MENQEWKVWFRSSFWGHRPDRTRPGREIPVGVRFDWNGHPGLIPAVYLCGKGLVADICVSAPAEEMDAWVAKMLAAPSEEEQERLSQENPVSIRFNAAMTVNGRLSRQKHGCGVGWLPHPPEKPGNSPEAEKLLEHYGLDKGLGWGICRAAIPWPNGRRPKTIRSLSITVTPGKREITGPRFRAEKDMVLAFPAPEGKLCTLRILEAENQSLPLPPNMQKEGVEYPNNCQLLAYTLEGEAEGFRLEDCSPGDRSRSLPGYDRIGGAAGPIAVFVQRKDGVRTACSASYFDPAPAVEWKAVFYRRPWPPVTAKLPTEGMN